MHLELSITAAVSLYMALLPEQSTILMTMKIKIVEMDQQGNSFK